MRKWVIVALLAALAIVCAAARGARRPPFLRPGDKVAIISPAGAHPMSIADNGVRVMREWGYEPVMGKSVGKHWHHHSGTIEQRRVDLLWALQDTSVKAIMCVRGGYGSPQLLTDIPLEVFRHNPKWIIGYSDITALLSANVSAGNMAIHANMCDPIARGDTTIRALQYLLAGKLPCYRIANHKYNVPGKARGVVVGGNLTVLTQLADTPFDCLRRDLLRNQDIILFFEDTHEDFKHVDRMLHQLMLRGVISHVKGLIIGHFNDYSAGYGYTDMYDMMERYFSDLGIPVCYDFPVGHNSRNNFPMIEGCEATLVVGSDSTSLSFELPLRSPLDR